MRKPAINFTIDAAAFLAFIFLFSTGLLIYWVLPAGSGNSSIWGLTRHDWGDIHFWIAIGFVSLIAAHFILHWSWIKSMVMGKAKERRESRGRILVAIFLLLVILLIAIAPLLSLVNDSGEEYGRSHQTTKLQK